MAEFRHYNQTELQGASITFKSVFPANPSPVNWEVGVRRNGAEMFHLQWKFQIIPNSMVRHFQEEQMGAYELAGFRRSEKEDVLAKPPGGVHLVQAKKTCPIRRLDEVWKCLQLCGGGLVEGRTFSLATGPFGSWWQLRGHLWERSSSSTEKATPRIPSTVTNALSRNNLHMAQPGSSLMESSQLRVYEFKVKDWHIQGQLSVGIRFPPAVWYYFSQHGFPCCRSLSLQTPKLLGLVKLQMIM